MTPKHAALAEREARLIRHCRAGLRRALEERAYREVVEARLSSHLLADPTDLFQAQPWIWAAALGLGRTPDGGPLAASIAAAGALLAEWLMTDDPVELSRPRWDAATSGALDLDSTLRSHPFADILAWSLLPSGRVEL